MPKVKSIVPVVLLCNTLTLATQLPDSGRTRPCRPNLDIGIESAELLQNRFRHLGPRNYTFIAGQRFWFGRLANFGWRTVALNVELSSEHLSDTRSVRFIEGNRTDLTGRLTAYRAYWDWYPPGVRLGWVPRCRRHVLALQPILGAGFGWTRSNLVNTKFNEQYDLRAFSINAVARLRTELLELLFIETPALDLALLIAKNRRVAGQIGDTRITGSEWWTIFGWINIGIRLRL